MSNHEGNELEQTAEKYGMDTPPQDGGPQTPDTYVLRKKAATERAQYPMGAQVAIGPKVAEELRTASEYRSDFGAGAPDAIEVANIVDIACGWSQTAKQTAAYLRYVRDQEAHAWSIAFAKGNLLEAGYAYLKATASGVADRYPMLGRFLQLTVTRAQRGAPKRKEKAAQRKNGAQSAKEKGSSTTSAATPAVGNKTLAN